MKYLSAALLALSIGATSYAQVIAGMSAPDQGIIEINTTILTNEPGVNESIDLDLNCDGLDDLSVTLLPGQPEVDWPHGVSVQATNVLCNIMLNSEDPLLPDPAIHLFEQGDTIDENSQVAIGASEAPICEVGGWIPFGPGEVSNAYIGYEMDGTYGWVELSFDLTDNTLELAVSRLLAICLTDDVTDMHYRVLVGPNPVVESKLTVQAPLPLQSAALIDMQGRSSACQTTGNVIEIEAEPGVYVLSLCFMDGRHWQSQVIVR